MQSVGTHRLLLSILESPHGLLKNLKSSVPLTFSYVTILLIRSGSTFDMTVMWVVYGIVASEADEEYHEMIERLLEAGEGVLTPGHYLVDVFPFLQFIPAWLPGGGFKRYASHVKGEMNEISGRLLQTAKERMVSTFPPGLRATLLIEHEQHTDTGRDSVLPRLLQRGNSSKDIAETRELDRICTDVGVTAYLGEYFFNPVPIRRASYNFLASFARWHGYSESFCNMKTPYSAPYATSYRHSHLRTPSSSRW